MRHDCEFNIGLSSSPADYTQCGKPAVTWVRPSEENPFYLCAEHYDVVVAKHPELEETI
jgi:hypothetical protein